MEKIKSTTFVDTLSVLLDGKIPENKRYDEIYSALNSENDLHTLLDNGLWVFDVQNSVFVFSDVAIGILGFKTSNIIKLSDFISGLKSSDKTNFNESFTTFLEKKESFELIIKSWGEKSLPIQLKAFVYSASKNDLYFGNVQDISQVFVQLNGTQKSKTREKSLVSDKVKAAFLYNISHEIRRPMNAILGFTELLDVPNITKEDKAKYKQIINTNAKFLLKLVDDITEISKVATGKLDINKSTFCLHTFLRELHEQYIKMLGERKKDYLEVKLSDTVQAQELLVYADVGRIQQVFSNLFSNAIKFTNKGYVELGYYIDSSTHHIVFYVKDTGIGMNSEEQKTIFDRFGKKTEASSKLNEGVGLGLTISKGVVDSMDGKIWLESIPDKGSTFYFSIPYEKVEAISDDKSAEDKINYCWKDKVVLIVEDEEVNRMFLETVFQESQVQLLFASNGIEALELVKSISHIDLVLLDLRIPEMDGIVVAQKIKKMSASMPIIVQTAFNSHAERKKCKEIGCEDYITKPIDVDLLLRKVDTIFQS